MSIANKKALHEYKRRQVRNNIAKHRQHNKVRQKRARELFIQGRKEYQTKRRADKNYIDQLEKEISNEASPIPSKN